MATHLEWSLPMPSVGAPGSTATLTSLLIKSFGASPNGWSSFAVSYTGPAQLAKWDFSYWNPKTPSVARWFVNGSVTPDGYDDPTTVMATQTNSAVLHAGNDIGALAFITVAAGPNTFIDYWIATIDPHVMSSMAGKRAPTPVDIVATARRFDSYFGHPLNDNDCHHIAAEVAAATGASLPIIAIGEGLNPAANQEGGFWRIAYRGSDPNPVANWQTIVKPGDVVRMGWKEGGPHTTTVLKVNADGSIQVYDNILMNHGRSTIGIHNATYGTETNPTKTTIWRLTTDGLYLENGSNQADTLPGTIFNDDVRGFAGNDNLSGAAGNDYLAGGPGNDVLNGGVGADFADYVGAPGAVTVSLLTNTSSGAAGNDTLISMENMRGSRFADTLTGNSANNVLDGGPGGDRMSGGGGSDTFVVDNVLDQVIDVPGGTDLVKSSVSYQLVVPIKNLTLTGSGNIKGDGNDLNNALNGNTGANTLHGFVGNDTLNGRAGRDTLTGGPGEDTFAFSTTLAATNIDTIMDFTVGVDAVQLSNSIFKGLPAGALSAAAFFRGAQAHDTNDRIIYNATGALLYDPDGTGPQAAMQFATVRNAPALTSADFFIV
jgi:Ca2+-binding RTX toxin-like protein